MWIFTPWPEEILKYMYSEIKHFVNPAMALLLFGDTLAQITIIFEMVLKAGLQVWMCLLGFVFCVDCLKKEQDDMFEKIDTVRLREVWGELCLHLFSTSGMSNKQVEWHHWLFWSKERHEWSCFMQLVVVSSMNVRSTFCIAYRMAWTCFTTHFCSCLDGCLPLG